MNEDRKSVLNQVSEMKKQIQELIESIACFTDDIF